VAGFSIRPVRPRGQPATVHGEGLAPNEYYFVDRWRLRGSVEEVAELIDHPEEFRRWWPAAWLDYESLSEADDDGASPEDAASTTCCTVGRTFRYRVKGWLPYSLKLTFRVTERRPPNVLVVAATGDLVGEGRWTLEQQGPKVEVTYEWRVHAERPLVRRLSSVLKPVFRSNHFWVMRQGAHSMMLELRRRRATSAEERALVPAPPGPIPPAHIGWPR
jgi:hypothetical protein